MDKMWDRTHQVFLEGISLRFEVVHLSDVRDHLFPNGIAPFFHRRHHGGGNAHRIVAHDGFDFIGDLVSALARSGDAKVSGDDAHVLIFAGYRCGQMTKHEGRRTPE